MTDATDVHELIDALRDRDGVLSVDRSEPIEGYDTDPQNEYEEVKITGRDGSTGGPLFRWLTVRGWYPTGVTPTQTEPAKTVILARNKPVPETVPEPDD